MWEVGQDQRTVDKGQQRNVINNQVWFLYENVLTKPIISCVKDNASFGIIPNVTMSWGEMAETTIPLFLQRPFSCV